MRQQAKAEHIGFNKLMFKEEPSFFGANVKRT